MSTFFKLGLSHTVDVESRPLLVTPQLELALDFARVIRVLIPSSPSPALYQQVEVDKRQSTRTALLRKFVYFNRSDDPIVRDTLRDVPELSADLFYEWEESVSSYIREAADGVWIGKLKVAADVELVTEIVCDCDLQEEEEEAAAAATTE